MMMRLAILALVASAALADTNMEASTIITASSGSLKQYWSGTSSASGSWNSGTLSMTGITTPGTIQGVAACKREDMMYVFVMNDNNVWRKSYAITESTGQLTETTTSWTNVRTASSSSVDYRAIACVDDNLYVSDMQTNNVLFAPDFTATSLDWSQSISFSAMTNPYGIFVSNTIGAFVDLYFANPAASGSAGTSDGVYEQELTYSSSSGFNTQGSANQWVASEDAYEIAVDTGGTVWFTTAASSSTIKRSTGASSTTTAEDMITSGNFNAGMRFSNQRLYFSSGSTVYFVSSPLSMSSSTLTSASKVSVGTHTTTVEGMAVYFAGSAVRALPTMSALFAAIAAAFLSRRFW